MLKRWEQLPESIRIPEVKPYWEVLYRKRGQLILKRIFDLIAAVTMTLILALPMLVISLLIWLDDRGPVMYRQERATIYGRHFRIHKFRTMVQNSEHMGTAVTVANDSRITRIGGWLRKLRLDELPQLFDVIRGDMSLVGPRPEAIRYVERYLPEYMATLLIPAGVTSETSICFRDEAKMLENAEDADMVYLTEILPIKMSMNLKSIKEFSFFRDIVTIFCTVTAIFGKRTGVDHD